MEGIKDLYTQFKAKYDATVAKLGKKEAIELFIEAYHELPEGEQRSLMELVMTGAFITSPTSIIRPRNPGPHEVSFIRHDGSKVTSKPVNLNPDHLVMLEKMEHAPTPEEVQATIARHFGSFPRGHEISDEQAAILAKPIVESYLPEGKGEYVEKGVEVRVVRDDEYLDVEKGDPSWSPTISRTRIYPREDLGRVGESSIGRSTSSEPLVIIDSFSRNVTGLVDLFGDDPSAKAALLPAAHMDHLAGEQARLSAIHKGAEILPPPVTPEEVAKVLKETSQKVMDFLMDQDKLVIALVYVTNEEYIWNKDSYVKSRSVGKAYGLECELNMMYVLGNAFIEGFIGNAGVRIYYRCNQGFQVYVWPLGSQLVEGETRPLTWPPHAVSSLYKELEATIKGFQ